MRDVGDTLRTQLKHQALIADISRQLLNLSFNELEDGMRQSLASMGQMARVSRAYLFLLSENGQNIANIYEWCAPGIQGHDFESMRGVSVDAFPWSMAQFVAGRTVIVYDPNQLPEEAKPERQACRALSISSYVNMPMHLGGRLLGWLGFDATGERRTWADEQLNLMGLAGDILISALDRKHRDELLFRETESAHVTLHSIGDAVITTDADATIEYLNPVAETLTGWPATEARGQRLETVFHLIDGDADECTASQIIGCLQEDPAIKPAVHCLLVNRIGVQYSIQVSAAPIRDRNGSVLGVVLVFRDETESHRMAQQLMHQASHDALTGLVNRREFESRMEHALNCVREHNTPYALCYLDLDRFKLVNDTAGHPAGDELLKQVANLFMSKIRTRDTLARLGGDEFGLLLENCPLNNALQIAEMLVGALEDYRFTWDDRTFDIGVSIGVIAITAEAVSIAEILNRADMACYTAKDRGHHRVQVYEAEDRALAQRRTEIHHAAGLRHALEHDQFRIVCQPILALAADDTLPLHYEILLRLQDRDGEMVLPSAFIPAAERYGLMGAIDRWVIENVFHYYAKQLNNSQGVRFAINLSGNSLNDDSLLAFVCEHLSRASVPPDRICFEITETACIQHLSQATRFIKQLREKGCEFALDDFGSGFSSFSYLKHLPIDYLKIDGSFVLNMVANPLDREMVKAINQVGHIIGARTIAEWVESEDTIQQLREVDVDFVQGYEVGLAIPLEELGEKAGCLS
ncbi:MAG: EAL domain-containing protein [Pseudomonadota bacterium]